MGVGQARGKLLLFGEHAAVYGHPALGLSLPWTLKVTSSPGPRWDLLGLGPYEKEVETLVGRLGTLAGEAGLPVPLPGRLSFETAIPLSSGFGSSGALCAALVNLFWPDRPLAQRDLLAWRAEAQFHGTPSGIDTALALREGWWALDTGTRPVTARALPDPGLVLVAGALVREGSTRSLVAGLGARKAAGDAVVIAALDRLGALSRRAADALNRGNAGSIPGLVAEAREALRSLELETPALTAVLDAGLACPGARAAKLSGAGGGGAFFVVFSDREAAQQALGILEAAAVPDRWTAAPRVVWG